MTGLSPGQIDCARAVPIDAEITRRGIKLRKQGAELVGPCPCCGGRDRFAINTRKQVFLCRRCRAGGDVIALVRHLDGCTFLEAVAILNGDQPRIQANPIAVTARTQSSDDYERGQHRKAARLWSRRQPIESTPAERYLREVRGITCPLPPTLAFLPPAKREHLPAMIAAFAMVDEPEPGQLGKPHDVGSVHLTLLRADGSGKAEVEPNKLVIGSPRGLPIILAPPNDLLGLAIAEGIEDTLTAHMATGLGAWAAGSASFMPRIADAVPDYIEVVTIYAHADQAGQDGAHKLAAALRARRIEVTIEGLSS